MYAIVDAQGWYGDWTKVWETAYSLEEARKLARKMRHVAIIWSAHSKGERVHRLEAERLEVV
jgi:hypothetical protein